MNSTIVIQNPKEKNILAMTVILWRTDSAFFMPPGQCSTNREKALILAGKGLFLVYRYGKRTAKTFAFSGLAPIGSGPKGVNPENISACSAAGFGSDLISDSLAAFFSAQRSPPISTNSFESA